MYIPAGTPHRYLPNDESIQLKYKASQPGAEAVVWHCTRCDSELFRHTFDPTNTTVETGYRQGDMAFNVDPGPHTCRSCGLRQD